MNKLIEEITKPFIEEETLNEAPVTPKIKNIVGIYPGRFQPFGKHHYSTFKWLQKMFGTKNTYVVTSNKVEKGKSPFNFREKSIIIRKHGVPSGKVVQIRNPYKADEVLKKYDPKTTAVVYLVGKKDASRLSGKYFQDYKKNRNKLVGFDQHSYVLIAPHYSAKIGGKDLSGTTIRHHLGSKDTDEKDKKKFFKQLMGFNDNNLFKLITGKLSEKIHGVPFFIKKDEEDLEEALSLKEEINLIVTEKPYKGKELLLMGGAAGHMMHPFDNNNLKFKDLKNIITLGLGGNLSREDNVTEKLDGQNIMISWKDGKIIAARNKGQLKNFGQNALDINGIISKFKGRGDIRDAFVFSMKDLGKAIGSLSQKQKDKIFDNGKNFMNLEIMWPKSENVINYDVAQLIFHGANTYDENGNVVGSVPNSARILAGMIRQRNQHLQKKFSIGKPNFLDVPKHQDFGKMKRKFLNKLSKLQKQYNLKDNDELALYHQRHWEEFIYNAAKQFKYKIPSKVWNGLTKRWAFFDKKYAVRNMRKDIKNEKFLEWALNYDKQNHKGHIKDNMKPFEELFFEVGAEIMKNVSGYISANPDKSVQKIKDKLDAAVRDVKRGGDLKKLNTLKAQMSKLNAIGGLKSIVPTEGIVFKYKGNTYKFTGAFAPINQITGLMSF